MTLVAGVDFGTQSVRVAVVDSTRGPLGTGVSPYPVNRRRDNPDFATQSHEAHMDALVQAMHAALADSRVDGQDIAAVALDTTGSTVLPVGENLTPLDDYYLWADHRAHREAAEITRLAHERGLEAIHFCGGLYSSEWGYAKLLHWLRNNPDKRDQLVTALEHCDMVAAVLCGITNAREVPRSVCAAGHKWLWNEALGGLPPQDFLSAVDPLFDGIREKLEGPYLTSDSIAGELSAPWAGRLGLRAGIPIPVGGFDAHWDAIGAGCTIGDVVNVVGTTTCIVAIAEEVGRVPGVCGVVKGSAHPGYMCVEAGLAGVGCVFEAIATRCNTTVAELSKGLESYRGGETGLLRMVWDNGDRTVLVTPELGGVTFGLNLNHNARDELFAAIEGTAFHTRIVLERMAEYGVPINRVIHGGGIAQKNEVLNRVYANVLGKPILVPERPVTGLGSAIFAFLAAGAFPSIEAAQAALCPGYRVIEPDAGEHERYEPLYQMYRSLYFSLGSPESNATTMGHVLPELRRLASAARLSS
jgi:L-ribulokinase